MKINKRFDFTITKNEKNIHILPSFGIGNFNHGYTKGFYFFCGLLCFEFYIEFKK